MLKLNSKFYRSPGLSYLIRGNASKFKFKFFSMHFASGAPSFNTTCNRSAAPFRNHKPTPTQCSFPLAFLTSLIPLLSSFFHSSIFQSIPLSSFIRSLILSLVRREIHVVRRRLGRHLRPEVVDFSSAL